MQKRIARFDAQQLDWVLLRSFLAIYRAGSIAAAARKLQLQQPTLSRQLALLESQLGLQLFERTSRGLQATSSAQQILSYVEQMEEAANRLSLSLHSEDSSLSGTVRIYATQLIAASLLPAILKQIMQQLPGLQIELVATDETPDLLNRNADIGFWTAPPQQQDIIARKIGEVQIMATASHAYLEHYGVPRDFAELTQHRLLGHDKLDVIWKWFSQFDAEFSPARFCLRTDDKNCYMAAIREGMGIGFVASYLYQVHRKELRQVLPDLPLPHFGLWLGTHREIVHNALIKTVYQALVERIAPLLDTNAN